MPEFVARRPNRHQRRTEEKGHTVLNMISVTTSFCEKLRSQMRNRRTCKSLAHHRASSTFRPKAFQVRSGRPNLYRKNQRGDCSDKKTFTKYAPSLASPWKRIVNPYGMPSEDGANSAAERKKQKYIKDRRETENNYSATITKRLEDIPAAEADVKRGNWRKYWTKHAISLSKI